VGSIADEMKKVLQMWDEEDQSQQEEIKVVNTTKDEKKQSSITNRILAVIEQNPGITSIGLRNKLSVLHPDVPLSFTSSMLKQFSDRFYVTRSQSTERIDGRYVYAYTVIPEADRKTLQAKAKEERSKAVARAAHARAVKEQKKAMKEMPKSFVQYENHSISDLVEKFKANSTKVEQPTEWSVDDVLDSLTVKQARALHIALKEMFGG